MNLNDVILPKITDALSAAFKKYAAEDKNNIVPAKDVQIWAGIRNLNHEEQAVQMQEMIDKELEITEDQFPFDAKNCEVFIYICRQGKPTCRISPITQQETAEVTIKQLLDIGVDLFGVVGIVRKYLKTALISLAEKNNADPRSAELLFVTPSDDKIIPVPFLYLDAEKIKQLTFEEILDDKASDLLQVELSKE